MPNIDTKSDSVSQAYLCESCKKNPAREPHVCPYSEELLSEEEGCHELCNCCEECEQDCLDDI